MATQRQLQQSTRIILWITTAAVLLVLVIALIATFWSSVTQEQNTSGSTESPYHAVFLSNGQVYFGKISESRIGITTLTDVYYLRTQQPLQAPQSTSNDADGEVSVQQQPQFTLIKLGETELHGPTDRMEINNDHVLYVVALRGDSAVVQTIQQHKQQKK